MKKINQKFVVLPIVLGAAFVALGSSQAKAADTIVGLQMNDFASITATASITVIPTLAEITAVPDGGSVTTTDNPITLTINSTHGADITFEGDGSDGTLDTLADADLALSSNGSTWVGAGDGATNLYTSSVAQSAVNVPINVKISNLRNYGVGTHNNTVTFTITDNS